MQLNIRDIAEKVRLALDGGGPPPGASRGVLQGAQDRFGVSLPHDLCTFYSEMDGTEHPTLPEHAAVRLWSIKEWLSVRDLQAPGLPSLYREHADAIVIADHRESSWWYAISIVGATRPTVLLIDGLRPAKQVAPSFSEFLEAVLADGETVYPTAEGAG